ncbi:hypothetical protein [Devosia sp.]|uniref:hypothetical protein n=1 Tax=Devosia sp. TaxID=1871048 RepID=UPI003263B619
MFALKPDDALIRLSPDSGHGHDAGVVCMACAGRVEIRALLFELLESVRQGLRTPFRSVVVDATALPDARKVIDAVAGRLPATAMRDHTVARSFHLVA